jgi:hypothetical protein
MALSSFSISLRKPASKTSGVGSVFCFRDARTRQSSFSETKRIWRTREVSATDAEEFCRSKGLAYIEGSAKTGANVVTLFEEMAKMCVENETVSPANAVVERPPEDRGGGEKGLLMMR